MTKRALITGITGQDGSYLAELLLEKGYHVHGIVRRSSSQGPTRIDHIRDKLNLHVGDLTDQYSLRDVLRKVEPDEVYNLAAQSFVPISWTAPALTSEVTGLGVTKLLEAVRAECPLARFYQASSSEMFGKVRQSPQTERTPFHPRSPYGVAKAYAHYMTVVYRESYGLFAVSGICFNHESPRRSPDFVTRKVTRAAARIALGLEKELLLGNLDAIRDWGHAKDYVRAMWMMLQAREPVDYVICTGVTHSVSELCAEAFECAELYWRNYVKADATYRRPAEVDVLCGSGAEIFNALGWYPQISFKKMIREMVDADLKAEAKAPGATSLPSAKMKPR